MKPLYIFDLDGTLALIQHRRPLVELQKGSPVTVKGSSATFVGKHAERSDDVWLDHGPSVGIYLWHKSDVVFKPNWPAFFKACVRDEPNVPVINTMRALVNARNDVWIWSGRSDEVRAETEDWLAKHVHDELPLKMRKAGNYTPDDQLKDAWLKEMEPADRQRLVVFDDRDRVVSMWRRNGVPCFQVAEGDF